MPLSSNRSHRVVGPLGVGLLATGLLLGLSAGLAASQEAQPTQPAQSIQPAQPALAPVKPVLDGNRGPYEVAFTPDGKTAVVTEFDEGALALVDVVSGKVTAHVPSGGKEPTGVAVTPDGKTALATNSFSGSVAFLDLSSRKVDLLPLRGAPYDVVVSPDGTTAYVSVSQLDELAVVDVATRKVAVRIPTGHRPRALSLTPDGKVLMVGNMQEGSVTFIDTASRQVFGTGPTTAVNLRGVAAFPNGRAVFATAQRAQNERPTETAVGVWSNQAFVQVPNGRRNTVDNIWLDLIGEEVSDPDQVVLSPRGDRAYMTCSGGHSVQVYPLRGGDTVSIKRVGAQPKGLTLTPDGKELWVANLLGNDLAVIDPVSLKVTRRIPMGPTTRKDPSLMGRFLFNTATIVKGEQFSCNSCHPEGNTDGISWKFVHVPDALGKQTDRNARSLRGAIQDTAPFRWTGHDGTLESFIRHEADGLLESPQVTAEQVKELAGFIGSMPLAPNPHRNEDGSFTAAGLRGQSLFVGKAGCAACHTGPKSGGQRKGWIGTTAQGMELDVPHLNGVFDSYPYLHDGRAKTLEEIFTRYNEQKQHGKASDLSPEELKDLLQYVREL